METKNVSNLEESLKLLAYQRPSLGQNVLEVISKNFQFIQLEELALGRNALCLERLYEYPTRV